MSFLLPSPSLRGRGLKCKFYSQARSTLLVALFTRAWIEIFSGFLQCSAVDVALFTRAWIEIQQMIESEYLLRCRPLYEGVDWNFDGKSNAPWPRTSPSLRGRGLKFNRIYKKLLLLRSPSLRGRGLKLNIFYICLISGLVALFTRAWIEIQKNGII